ncbi:MAG: proton-conducting transporter membrane subunit, partial [Bacteroidota bacterium]
MLPVLPVLPVILPLLFIVLLSFFKNKSKWVPIISVAGTSALTIISLVIIQIVHQQGIMVLYVGNWQAPFGISLVIDLFSAIMLVVSSIVSLAVAIYASTGVATELRRFFYLLFFALVMGVNGAFSTGDIFNLYVWYELMLMASFALITLGGTKQQLEGGIKYLSMNLVSSLFFLAGIGFLYGQTGTLNMADLAQLLRVADESIQVEASAMLFFVAFSIKSALFPVFFWLPSSYHTPALPVTALFAGLLTKVGVYSMIRFYTLIF